MNLVYSSVNSVNVLLYSFQNGEKKSKTAHNEDKKEPTANSIKPSVNQEGEPVFTPRPTFEQVVGAAPATAMVTIQFEGRDYTTTFPVMVTEEIRQLPSHSRRLSSEDLGQGGGYESIDEANRVVPFTLREPSHLPSRYRVAQIVVEEPNTVDTGWHAWFVCMSERNDPSKQFRISARPADDPRVPGHLGNCISSC